MAGARSLWIDVRRHRLHALSRERRHQSRAVALQAFISILVSERRLQIPQVLPELLEFVHQGSPFA